MWIFDILRIQLDQLSPVSFPFPELAGKSRESQVDAADICLRIREQYHGVPSLVSIYRDVPLRIFLLSGRNFDKYKQQDVLQVQW